MFTSPGQIFFSIGSFSIYFYGIFMALAMLVGIFVSNFIRKKFYPQITEKDFFDISLIIIIGGIIGARLYYTILNFDYYTQFPNEILNIRQGGMAIHGGIIGGMIAGIIYATIKRLPILNLCDIYAYGLVLAQAIGRWGNFFNSEAFGYPTNIFCKLYIAPAFRPIKYMNFEYFHPTFLYESILNILIFLILIFVIQKLAKHCSGIVFCAYLILYSIVRIIVEHFRIDSVLNIGEFAFPTIISFAIIVIATLTLLIILKRNKLD